MKVIMWPQIYLVAVPGRTMTQIRVLLEAGVNAV